jgi:hypothetical protein
MKIIADKSELIKLINLPLSPLPAGRQALTKGEISPSFIKGR